MTNPERFFPLLGLAVDIVSDLREAYEVIEPPTFERLPGSRSPFEYARPPIILTPVSPKEAPISVAFTAFPGLFVCLGKFIEESFPSCGCDACAPTFEREAERLQATVRSVVAGHFQEEIEIPLVGSAYLSWTFTASASGDPSTSGRMMLSREEARRISAVSERIEWQPWTKRTRD